MTSLPSQTEKSQRIDSILAIMLNGNDIEGYNKILPSFEARMKKMIQTELEHCEDCKLNLSDKEVAAVLTRDFHYVWNDFRTVLENVRI